MHTCFMQTGGEWRSDYHEERAGMVAKML